MRRLLKWTIVTLGIAALVHWFKRRGNEAAVPPSAAADDPADELRRKLAESRVDLEPDAPPAPATETVDERRAGVHELGRSALSQMAPSDEE